MDKKTFKKEFAGKTIEIEFSPLAEQADASCLIKYGETVALVTFVSGKQDRQEIDFFPLTVDYEEKYYAAGKIYGSRFIRRETRPTEAAILTGRMIDRTLRPLFDKNTRREVQIVITVLSIDGENDPEFVGLLGASLVSCLSPIPFQGPVSGVRIAQTNGQTIVSPAYEQRETAKIDSFWGGTKNKINMIEVSGQEAQENEIAELSLLGHKQIQELIAWQEEIIKELSADPSTKLGTNKIEVKAPAEKLTSEEEKLIKEFINQRLEPAIFSKQEKNSSEKPAGLEALQIELKEMLENQEKPELEPIALRILDKMIDRLVHEKVLTEEKRVDSRKLDEIRPIEAFIGVLPRTHGSGLFMRGSTHALSVLTLGAPGDILLMQGMEITGEKRFMHHYNFPPYSTGETKPLRGPGRREIGHGALAEKALAPLIPSQEEFPYTIRIVTEILSSNGSTSMASVCGSSLALMNAGVPIKTHIAGIALGLIVDEKGNYKILTDIQGPEDHYGDMDCKVAGTKNGITAIQMDVKIEGIDSKILTEILDRAKQARLQIIEKMERAIDKPSPELSQYAPRVLIVSIPKEKIGGLIGTGGKTIHAITDQTGAVIDIEEDGTVYITAETKEAAEKTVKLVEQITKEYEVGEVVEGKISKILDFGAIVELGPNQEGMIHISELAPRRVESVDEVVKIGQVLPVKIIEVLPDGKIRLSLKQVTHPENHQNHGPRKQ
ncbi:MAG: polyribonucleotide nucleotidyltransferase [Patescibacteria group bacterium]